MSSPITADDFTEFNPAADLCSKFDQLLAVSEKLKIWFEWAFDSAGNWTDEAKAQLVEAAMPIGTVVLYAGNSVPSDKWLLCNGSEVSRDTYPDLFSRIGTIYGAGNGSTSFNIPNFSGNMPIGVGSDAIGNTGGERTVELTEANIPPHSHVVPLFQIVATDTNPGGQTLYGPDQAGFTAANLDTEETGGGDEHNNMPPYLAIHFIIKAKA